MKVAKLQEKWVLEEKNIVDSSKSYQYCSITPEYAILWNNDKDRDFKKFLMKLMRIKKPKKKLGVEK